MVALVGGLLRRHARGLPHVNPLPAAAKQSYDSGLTVKVFCNITLMEATSPEPEKESA